MNTLRAHHAPVFHHPHRVCVHMPHPGHWVLDHPRLIGFLLACIFALLFIMLASIIHLGISSGTWPFWNPAPV